MADVIRNNSKPISIEVLGTRDIIRALEQMKTRTAIKVARSGLRAGARVIQRAIQSEAPVARGILRESIIITFSRGARDFRQLRAIIGPFKGRRTSSLAAIVEFGRPAFRQPNTGIRQVALAPDPFMRRGLDKSRNAAFRATREASMRAIMREVKRLARGTRKPIR